MNQSNPPLMVSVPNRNFFDTYFKACGAMMQVCYGRNWFFGEPTYAAITISNIGHIVSAVARDATGTQIPPEEDSEFIGFHIIPSNRDLEHRLINQLQKIISTNADFCSPRPADFIVCDE